jgi:urease accessory protein
MNGRLEVRVEGTTVVHLVATPPIAAKILPGPVLMLVGSAAGLLAGDSLKMRLELAGGASLNVRTTAAMLAHPCDGGGRTSTSVDCRLGPGAHLTWLPEPLIACRACHHTGRAQVRLGVGASAVWLDTITLGRTGEEPGRLEQRLDVAVDGHALLREGLRLEAGWDGPAVLGGHRHLANLHLLGRRLPPEVAIAGAMQLAGPGTTVRLLAHRGDELARQVSAILPLFLPPGPPGSCLKEAVHV